MPVAARKFLGLRAHTLGQTEWSPDEFYSPGDVVTYAGHQWRAILPTARGHAPQGVGDGSPEDRQLLLDQLKEGWGALAGTVGAGLGTPTYTVTSTADTDTGTATSGTLRHALEGITTPLWIVFDPTVFPMSDPRAIAFTTGCESYPRKTVDGRGAGVILKKYPVNYRSDIGGLAAGQHIADIVWAYVTMQDYPNITSVLTFGGINPWRRGGADKVYLHHLTVWDIEDQMMSNGQHGHHVSRSTTDWCRFGPSPGPTMMSLTTGGVGLKRFQVDATDVTNNTITALDPLGNPTNHGLKPPFQVNLFVRTGQTFPTGLLAPGKSLDVHNVGQPGAAQKDFTADASTETFTSTAHSYSNGDAVVLIGSSLPGGLRNGLIYYVKNVTANTFKLSTKADLSNTRDLTSNGSGSMKVQKADVTRMQFSDGGTPTSWAALDVSGLGNGWYIETTEPAYYENGKGPQYGSHHPDDALDGMMTFTADPATDVITTTQDHLLVDGDRVRFFSQASNLPAPLVQGVTYYIRDHGAATFKLAATLGGPVIHLTSAGQDTQSVTFDGTTDLVYAPSHGLSVDEMVAFIGGALPTGFETGVNWWVSAVPDADHFSITQRKFDPAEDINAAGGSGTLIKRPVQAQVIVGPNRVSMTKNDYRGMKIRSPKMMTGWYHQWNCRGYKWGEPARGGGGTGGFATEMGDGAQSLIEYCVFTPYSSTGTEAHAWSAYTAPLETVAATEPSVVGINIDSSAYGTVNPADWTGGAAAFLRGNNFQDGAVTRNATGNAPITSVPLDWYDGITQQVPYDYDAIPVTDPFILDTILDRGAGNVQPWELVD